MRHSRFILPAAACGIYCLFALLHACAPPALLYAVLALLPLSALGVLLFVPFCDRTRDKLWPTLPWLTACVLGAPALSWLLTRFLMPHLVGLILAVHPLSAQGLLACNCLLPPLLLLPVLALILHRCQPETAAPGQFGAVLALCGLAALHLARLSLQGGQPDLTTGLIVLALIVSSLLTALILHLIWQASAQQDKRGRFIGLLVQILVQVSTADGPLTRANLTLMLDFFRQKLGCDEDRLEQIKGQIRRALDKPAELETLLRDYRSLSTTTAHLILLELVYDLIHTRTPPSAAGLNLAARIADLLGAPTGVLRHIHAKYQNWDEQPAQLGYDVRPKRQLSGNEAKAFAILGLDPDANWADVKRAWRRLIKQYHPDKAERLGREFRRIAESRTKLVNAAYEYLKTRRHELKLA